jgi:hypothetical protein
MNYHIGQILKEKTIISYLEEKGISPQKKSGDKTMYCCPIHSGDNDPSFVVYPVGYKGREYETYYCFGCHSGITLINLKCDLESVTKRECIRYFLKDVKIDTQDAVDSIISDAKKNKLGIEENNEVEFYLLLINAMCRRFTSEDCFGDEEEIAFFDHFLERVESIARANDVKLLEGIYDLLDKGVTKRFLAYKKRKEEEEAGSLNWKI